MITTAYFTNHEESEATFMGDPTKHDPGLTDIALERIEHQCGKLFQSMTADSGAVLCSPLKRCLQTCLATYETRETCPTIYVMSILTDNSPNAESDGRSLQEIQNDEDLKKYKHFDRLNFNFFMWHNPNIDGTWFHTQFKRNRGQRLDDLWEFLGEVNNVKCVHIITHSSFITQFIQKQRNMDNYATWSVPIEGGRPVSTWQYWQQIMPPIISGRSNDKGVSE